MNQLCKVCGEPAAGFHFGAFTCEGCKSFFGRTYNNVSGVSECKNGGRCEINKKNRTSCKSCRLRKCLQVGMSKSGSRYGRRSNWFKIHCLLSAQSQQNGGGGISSLPETNNNNSTVTNNNSSLNSSTGNNHHSINKNSLLPSTITSHHSSIGTHGSNESDRNHHRKRSSSSAASHISNSTPVPPPFPHLSSMSPDSKEQFLSSLNRKMMSPELFEYFRAANMNQSNGHSTSKGFYPEDRGDDMSRHSRSPGSLESPNSEASAEDTKGSLPLFGMPPGSPLDVKPNDILSFDLLTRDLMKLGYDPLRLWPAMLSTPSSLHQFNPYRFMFPNFPAFGGPPGLPPPASLLNNGFLGPSPLLKNEGLLPTTKLFPGTTTSQAQVMKASSLTPPISQHGSDEPLSKKPRKLSTSAQDEPIDLSTKTNNNEIDSPVHFKGEILDHSGTDISDIDDEEDHSIMI